MDNKMNIERDVLSVLKYPFDANYILSKKKKIKRQLLNLDRDYLSKRVAILGGSTTNEIKIILEIFLLGYGIKPEFYESEYNRYYQDAMFTNEELEQFHPDIIYICTSNRNITAYPQLSDTAETVQYMLQSEIMRFGQMWNRLKEVYHCPIIQNNMEMPLYRLQGNRDASDIHGKVNYITSLNMEFYRYAQQHEDFYICDINYLSADYGLEKWSDPFYWYMYKYALNVSAIPYLSFNVANIIKSIFGKNKKGFVLDLDNTLWGGVIGDDGIDNIMLGPEEAEGQAYVEFQSYIKEHMQMGVLLSINSKNDMENAMEGLNHPDSVLRAEDFIDIKANWNPKNLNYMEIANDIKILPESLVFIDDNPAEREIVTANIPCVCAPDIGQVQEFIKIIDRSGFFEVTNISEDDKKRNIMYRQNVQRKLSETNYQTYEEYLKSLEMEAVIRPFESIYMARIAQLTNKSNQFNLTTKRYTQEDLELLAEDDNYITLYGKLEDRFGDNGVVSVIIGRIEESICHIELWLMSCRVLKRDMELAMFDELINQCRQRKITNIKGYYSPTAKNKMVADFYGSLGFDEINVDDIGNCIWEYRDLKKYKTKNKYIKVEGN